MSTIALKSCGPQIANRFKNYDQRLLFAALNEVMVEDDYNLQPLNTTQYKIVLTKHLSAPCFTAALTPTAFGGTGF